MADYEFLSEETLVDYLRGRSEIVGRLDLDNIASIKEIGDGNLNLVFLVKDVHGAGVCVKQALPYVRMVGEGWPMTPNRAFHEVNSLSVHGSLVPDLVPEVFFYDSSRYIFALEDLSDHKVWRGALNNGEIHEGVAVAIGRFMGSCAFGTSCFALERNVLGQEVAKAVNPELCLITEDLVFTEPLVDAGRNSYLEANAEDVAQFQADEVMMEQMGYAKWLFLSRAETLIHGDLHSGSVMVRKACDGDLNADSVKIFDSEFAFYGPQAFDLGAVWANLVLAASRAFALGEDERAAWLLDQVVVVWENFEGSFRALWPSRRDPRVFGDVFLDGLLAAWQREAWLFAAAKMSRRVVGAAKVSDVQSLPEDLRVGAVRGILRTARELVRQCYVDSAPANFVRVSSGILLDSRTV